MLSSLFHSSACGLVSLWKHCECAQAAFRYAAAFAGYGARVAQSAVRKWVRQTGAAGVRVRASAASCGEVNSENARTLDVGRRTPFLTVHVYWSADMAVAWFVYDKAEREPSARKVTNERPRVAFLFCLDTCTPAVTF